MEGSVLEIKGLLGPLIDLKALRLLVKRQISSPYLSLSDPCQSGTHPFIYISFIGDKVAFL